ncbi:MAG: hypothetical protein AAFV19_11360 [Pseudomonadota bacterium]
MEQRTSGKLGRWAVSAAIIWAVGLAVWVPLILWSGILQPIIDLLTDIEGAAGLQFYGPASLMHMKLSVAFTGVQGLAVHAVALAAVIVGARAVPGWAVMLIGVLAGALIAAFFTPPDLLVQLAFMGCGVAGTIVGLIWGRRLTDRTPTP